jgi:hypothetical protein
MTIRLQRRRSARRRSSADGGAARCSADSASPRKASRKDTEYLVHAVPQSLTPHLHLAKSDPARLTSAVYRNFFDLHAAVSPSARRTALALNAARAGATPLLKQFNQHIQPGEWIPQWATSSDFAPALRDTLIGIGPNCSVVATACTVLDGRPIAVTATSSRIFTNAGDCELHVWDLATGRQIGEPLAHDGSVCSLACTVLDGRPIAATGTDHDNVYVWDIRARRPLQNFVAA